MKNIEVIITWIQETTPNDTHMMRKYMLKVAGTH